MNHNTANSVANPTGPKYKKYIVIQYHTYYPVGGLNDITGSFDTLDEAKECVRTGEMYDYSEIVDRDTWEIVWQN